MTEPFVDPAKALFRRGQDKQYLLRFMADNVKECEDILSSGFIKHNKNGKKEWLGETQRDNEGQLEKTLLSAIPGLWKLVEPVLQRHAVKMNVEARAILFCPQKDHQNVDIQANIKRQVFPVASLDIHASMVTVMGKGYNDFAEAFAQSASVLEQAIENNEAQNPSDTIFICIDKLWVNVRKYTPMRVGADLKTPKTIIGKQAILNPTNCSNECGRACLLMAHNHAKLKEGAEPRFRQEVSGNMFQGKQLQNYNVYKKLVERDGTMDPFKKTNKQKFKVRQLGGHHLSHEAQGLGHLHGQEPWCVRRHLRLRPQGERVRDPTPEGEAGQDS